MTSYTPKAHHTYLVLVKGSYPMLTLEYLVELSPQLLLQDFLETVLLNQLIKLLPMRAFSSEVRCLH